MPHSICLNHTKGSDKNFYYENETQDQVDRNHLRQRDSFILKPEASINIDKRLAEGPILGSLPPTVESQQREKLN